MQMEQVFERLEGSDDVHGQVRILRGRSEEWIQLGYTVSKQGQKKQKEKETDGKGEGVM